MAHVTKLDDDPIVSGTAASFRLPTVAHICRATGHDQIVPMAKKHITARKHEPAILHRSQIEVATNAPESIPIGRHFAIDAQSRHATIRIDFETQMREALLV